MPPALPAAVAAVVRRLADERGLSARSLALAAGLDPGSTQRKLRGGTPLTLADLELIAPALGVSVADVIAWAERD